MSQDRNPRLSSHGPVLVLDGRSRAALETTQSLGRAGVAVHVSSERECLAHRSRYCHRAMSQPDAAGTDAFVEWLERLSATEAYALIVPSTERSLRCLMRVPESHAMRRASVLPSNHAMEIGLDKQRTWELAQSVGVSVPHSRFLASGNPAAPPGKFPVVLKPAMSLVAAGAGVVGLAPVIARTVDEWRRALDQLLRLCPVLEQEHVAGRGVGIECLYRHGTCVWMFQHERVHELPLTGGGSSYRRSMPLDAGLTADAKRLLDALSWHGVAMVEFKGSPESGYRLMEINPRLWGSLALAIDAGVDFPMGLLKIARGLDPGPQPRYDVSYYTRNLEMELDWFKDNLRADRSDPLLLTRPVLRSMLELSRPLIGRESWDHFDAADWRVWSHVLWRTAAATFRGALAPAARRIRGRLLRARHRRVLNRLLANGPLKRILFVCYGNICRSPFAEIVTRKLRPDLEVGSAGFHHRDGRSTPQVFRAIAGELGVDLAGNRSRRIDREIVTWADLVVVADLANLERFGREFPDARRKVTLLGMFAPCPQMEIADPYSLSQDQARAAAHELMAAVQGFASWAAPRH